MSMLGRGTDVRWLDCVARIMARVSAVNLSWLGMNIGKYKLGTRLDLI